MYFATQTANVFYTGGCAAPLTVPAGYNPTMVNPQMHVPQVYYGAPQQPVYAAAPQAGPAGTYHPYVGYPQQQAHVAAAGCDTQRQQYYYAVATQAPNAQCVLLAHPSSAMVVAPPMWFDGASGQPLQTAAPLCYAGSTALAGSSVSLGSVAQQSHSYHQPAAIRCSTAQQQYYHMNDSVSEYSSATWGASSSFGTHAPTIRRSSSAASTTSPGMMYSVPLHPAAQSDGVERHAPEDAVEQLENRMAAVGGLESPPLYDTFVSPSFQQLVPLIGDASFQLDGDENSQEDVASRLTIDSTIAAANRHGAACHDSHFKETIFEISGRKGVVLATVTAAAVLEQRSDSL